MDILVDVWQKLLETLDEKVILNGTRFLRMERFHPKKGGGNVGKTKRGKGTKLMVVADGKGIPIGLKLTYAMPHEATLIESTLDTIRGPRTRKDAHVNVFPD